VLRVFPDFSEKKHSKLKRISVLYMGVLRKAVPLLFLLLLALMLSVYLAVPGIAGRIVVKVFEEGTGCKVTLKNPKVDFLSLITSIESVTVLCRARNTV
jgi:hypothetical protein